MLEGDSPPEYVAVVHEAAGCTSAGGASRGWRTRPRTRKTVLTRVFLAHQRRRSSGERVTDVFPDLPGAADGDAPLRLTLLDALARLPAKDRAVIVLRYWEDRSVEQTADVLNVSSAAVRTRCSRALGRLRELLGEELSEYARR